MDTYYAPAEKAEGQTLAKEIEIISQHHVMSELLHSVSGLLAILDEHRQIVAMNDSFLKALGVQDPSEALGMRPGEALKCIHAHDEPAGCGTTPLCPTCGAAIAMVSSLGQDQPVEKTCALTATRGANTVDLYLMVRSHPIRINERRFLLLFLQDITRRQQRAALERTFFHDVNNLLNVLVGASDMLVQREPSKLTQSIHKASLRLHKEVAIQQCLAENETDDYDPVWQQVTTAEVFSDLRAFFDAHPAVHGKSIEFKDNTAPIAIKTDFSLLSRVLCNMIINALEATGENGVVKVWCEDKGAHASFCVWNAKAIPTEVIPRVFQRNFSTKTNAGRGIGTFSMKLFGERILGGQVVFTTSEAEGTLFTFALPR